MRKISYIDQLVVGLCANCKLAFFFNTINENENNRTVKDAGIRVRIIMHSVENSLCRLRCKSEPNGNIRALYNGPCPQGEQYSNPSVGQPLEAVLRTPPLRWNTRGWASEQGSINGQYTNAGNSPLQRAMYSLWMVPSINSLDTLVAHFEVKGMIMMPDVNLSKRFIAKIVFSAEWNRLHYNALYAFLKPKSSFSISTRLWRKYRPEAWTG